MIQTLDGHTVYVVDLKEVPQLPITWETEEEKPYATALAAAIHDGVITEPGKYGVEVVEVDGEQAYSVWNVQAVEEAGK